MSLSIPRAIYADLYGPTKGDDFETISVRIAGDSSLPKKWTPRKLVSLSLWVQGAPPVGDEMVDGGSEYQPLPGKPGLAAGDGLRRLPISA